MPKDKLDIRISEEGQYDLYLEIKIPCLVEMYSGNESRLVDKLRAQICSFMGDALLPPNVQKAMMEIDIKNQKEKLRVIGDYRGRDNNPHNRL